MKILGVKIDNLYKTEIIKKVGLITWSASGKNLSELADKMRHQQGVEQVIAWGNELRICGTDAQSLQEAVDQNANFKWQQVGTSLEEVFIHLVNERAAEQGAS